MAGTVRKAADGSWIADVTVNGIRRTGKCKTRSEALARKRELLDLLMQREAKPAAAPIFTMKEARALSMRIRWAGLAYERTAAIYSKEAVEFFGEFFPVNEITAALVDGWRQQLLAKGNRPSTVNRKVSAIRAMLSDAHLHGHLQEVPRMPQQLRMVNTKDRVISDDERDRFCAYFRQIGEPAAADVLVFLLETACRWGEAERLKGQDVDLVKGRVTFWATKNGKPRSVPLTRRAIEAIEPHLPAIPSHKVWPFKYTRYQHLFNTAKAMLGLGNDRALSIHTTRHTCASKLASRGIPLHQLMAYGGWTSLASVQRYLHLHTDALAACVNALEDA
jgi:integrase